jgi:hypothetical protein
MCLSVRVHCPVNNCSEFYRRNLWVLKVMDNKGLFPNNPECSNFRKHVTWILSMILQLKPSLKAIHYDSNKSLHQFLYSVRGICWKRLRAWLRASEALCAQRSIYRSVIKMAITFYRKVIEEWQMYQNDQHTRFQGVKIPKTAFWDLWALIGQVIELQFFSKQSTKNLKITVISSRWISLSDFSC